MPSTVPFCVLPYPSLDCFCKDRVVEKVVAVLTSIHLLAPLFNKYSVSFPSGDYTSLKKKNDKLRLHEKDNSYKYCTNKQKSKDKESGIDMQFYCWHTVPSFVWHLERDVSTELPSPMK